MEKRIPLIIAAILLTLPCLNAQEISQEKFIQLYLWAELDAYPESYSAEKETHPEDTEFSYPIRRIKELAPFLLEGMIYGWDFVYTPSDKQRGVAEYFERTEIKPLGNDAKNIIYKHPFAEDGKLNVWIEFSRTQAMISYLKYWTASTHPKIRGTGSAPVQDGFDGISKACGEAIKDAVRTYFRTQIRNKPKEISGKVLLRRQPRISTDSGQYVVDLDFFIETVRIIPYIQF